MGNLIQDPFYSHSWDAVFLQAQSNPLWRPMLLIEFALTIGLREPVFIKVVFFHQGGNDFFVTFPREFDQIKFALHLKRAAFLISAIVLKFL